MARFAEPMAQLIEELKKLLQENKGRCAVQFVLNTPSHGAFRVQPELGVKMSAELLQSLNKLLGEKCWELATV